MLVDLSVAAQIIQMLREVSARGKPVCICTDQRTGEEDFDEGGGGGRRRPNMSELAPFGTTADVIGIREEDSLWYSSCVVVKFLGRQRFQLLESFKRMNG